MWGRQAAIAIDGLSRRALGERRFGNLASGLGDGCCGAGADGVVAECSVKTELAHAWVGLAFAVQFFAELA